MTRDFLLILHTCFVSSNFAFSCFVDVLTAYLDTTHKTAKSQLRSNVAECLRPSYMLLHRENFNHLILKPLHDLLGASVLCRAPKAEFLLQNYSFSWPMLDINLEMYSWDTFHYKCFHYHSQLPCSIGFHLLSSHAPMEYRFNLCYNSIQLNKTWWVHPIVVCFISTDTRFPLFHIHEVIHCIYSLNLLYPRTLPRTHLHSACRCKLSQRLCIRQHVRQVLLF